MKIRTEIDSLEEALRALGNAQRAEGEKRYLKSRFDFLGVGTPKLRRLARTWLQAHPGLEPSDLRRISRALFSRRIHELKAMAILLLQERWRLLEPGDLDLLEWMLRRSYTWAYVDALAVHVVGPLTERYPGLQREIDRWATDHDFWMRRSAVLSLLLPLRRGEGDWPRFVRYADRMLEEREFFIRKSLGWILREVSKKRPTLVASFVERRLGRLSGVTFREAVKYLPKPDKDRLGARFRQRST